MSRSAPADRSAQRAVLDRVGSLEREHAVLYAKRARARAEMARVWGADQDVFVELAGTAQIGQGKAGGELARSERLVQLFPIALGLLELGVMRVGTVEVLLAVTKNASPEVQQVLDTRLSERICPMDAVDVRRLVAATLLQVESELEQDAQRERHEKARANRGVWAFPVEDGMARIGAELDELDAKRWCLDFDELVRAQKVLDDRDGVVRTQAQRRADVFALLPSRLLGVADAAAKGRLGELQGQVDLLRQQAGADQAESDQTSGESEVERAERLTALQAQVALMREDAATDPMAVPSPRAGSDDSALFDVTADADADEATLFETTEAEVEVEVDAEAGGIEHGAVVPCGLSRDDVLLGLLRLPVRNPATLFLHTPMTTVLDLDQRSGWLEGFGPVPAMRARMLLATANLRRVAVDERTGVPLGIDPHVGINPPWRTEVDLPDRHPHQRPQRQTQRQARRQRPRSEPAAAPEQVLRDRLLQLLGAPMFVTDSAEPQHDPSTTLRAFARLRDQTCDGPGCPRSATRSELDHEQPYSEGGVTAIWNLKHRSTRCHHVKDAGWTVVHDHTTGVTDWTSPAGSTYQRLSPWQPPTALPEDLTLPEPRLHLPTEPEPDWPDTDRPLWRDPEPPQPRERRSRRRVWNLDDGPVPPWHRTEQDPPPAADDPRPTSWDDGGPPPF